MSESTETPAIDDAAVKRVGPKMVDALRKGALDLDDIRAASACAAVLLFEQGPGAFEAASPADVVTAAKALKGAQPITWSALTAKAATAKRGEKPSASVNLHRVSHSIAAHKPAKHGETPTTAQPEDLEAIVASLRS